MIITRQLNARHTDDKHLNAHSMCYLATLALYIPAYYNQLLGYKPSILSPDYQCLHQTPRYFGVSRYRLSSL